MDFIDDDGYFSPVAKSNDDRANHNHDSESDSKLDIDNPYIFSNILELIHQGEEPYSIFHEITEAALSLPGITGAGLFLYNEKNIKQVETVARLGVVETKDYDSLISASDCFIADVMSLGAVQGVLICCYESLPLKSQASLEMLGHHASVVYERQRLSKNLQHFLDRIQTLNELYKVIATCQDRKSVLKKLVKEASLRFSSDVSIVYTWNEENKNLEVQNGYGCSSGNVVSIIDKKSPILWEIASKGGFTSFSPTNSIPEAEWLKNLGLKTVVCTPLEVPGEKIGLLVVGFQDEFVVTKTEVTGFKEFSAGAATAIYNASNHERVKNYAQNLEKLVEERTKELAIQTQRAEEANHAKSSFLANMSHELRTPLTAIVGYSSVMADGLYGEIPPKQLEALNSITKSSDHLKTLIDDILNLAKIESGKEVPSPVEVSLDELLNHTIKMFTQTANTKKVEITPIKIAEEFEKVNLLLDRKHSRQILFNLLSNAVKYTPEGGKVWVTTNKVNNNFLSINIHDTGIGISEGTIKKLFDRFERGNDPYSREQEGTGIGLNLTQKLVEINGGKIYVKSEVGKGSVFSVELPIFNQSNKTDNSVQPKAELPEQLKNALEGLTALIVDNNNETCNVLKAYMESKGAKVQVENSVLMGIQNFKNLPSDIILTDLAFKGNEGDGIKLIEEIRASKGNSAMVPIIAISACAFENDKKAAQTAGANQFISKPFTPKDVVNEILRLTKNT